MSKSSLVKYIVALLTLLATCMESPAQWNSEVEGNMSYSKVLDVLMPAFFSPQEYSSNGFFLSCGYNLVYRRKSGKHEFAIGGNMGYRNSTYRASYDHTTAQNDWSFRGDFLEIGGVLSWRGVPREDKRTVLNIAVMPNYNLLGKYRLYIDQQVSIPIGDTLNTVITINPQDLTYSYLFGYFGFRVAMGLDFYVSERMRLRAIVNLGSSSRIASFDFGGGVCYTLRRKQTKLADTEGSYQ